MGDMVIGFMMWAVADDKRYWLGGIFIDTEYQGKGYGKTAIQEVIKLLREKGASEFALSYHPDNEVAKRLYATLGFVQTGEVEDDEVVARLLPQ
jgi:diamine N-acetyltransferase